MKIVAGIGSADDYEKLAVKGADEMFCGFVPYSWNKKYGSLFPLNRREVLYYNVQINALADMKILKKMMEVYGKEVAVTFNYLYYLEEQYEEIAFIITELINIGYKKFIIADIGLLLYLKKNNINCNIHLSGECAEINSLSIDFLNQFNINRYIFHRKNTIEDMKSCIKNNKVKNLEYEAFILNERCHFTGAFCSSFHADELIHICKIPYIMGKTDIKADHFKKVDERFEKYYDELIEIKEDSYNLGSTGCGLCSLKKLEDAGITHLKVVGRGNYIQYMEQDVSNLKKALDILKISSSEEEFKTGVMKTLFNDKCSRECYYNNI